VQISAVNVTTLDYVVMAQDSNSLRLANTAFPAQKSHNNRSFSHREWQG
jgi:hypothetical protein